MSDDTEGLMLTRRSVQRVDRAVNAFEHSPLLLQSERTPPIPPQRMWYYAKTASAVTAGSFTSPTAFTYDIWVPDPTSVATNPPLIVSTDPDELGLDGVNYWNFTATSGTQFRMIFGFDKWIPAWGDC